MKWLTDPPAMKADFERDGFVVAKQFFDIDEVKVIQRNLDRYLVEQVPTLPKMDAFFEQNGGKKSVKQLPRMNHHDPFFAEMLEDSRIREVTEYLWADSAIPKDAAFFDKPINNNQPTPPHQDGYYFRLDPCIALTAWLALEDVDEQNGCVRYVKGSHKYGIRAHHRTNVLGFSQGIEGFPTAADSRNEIAVCVEPGDVIFHDGLTIHRAERNKSSTRSRRALGFVYFSSQAKEDTAANAAYQKSLAKEWQQEGKI